ncbi:MAG TPA: thioredoxin fold domain-containing protein [Phycisphaerales bacterium]|nr:thioredoxin fold domain-containing protein [Phycisphaerales bacterium]
MKRKPWQTAMIVVSAAVVVLSALHILRGGTAPTPAPFATGATVDEAIAASSTSGRPALVFATADWCGPCQSFKRGALADARVGAWIEENAHAAMADLTNANDARARELAERLAIQGVPALVMLRDGREVARIEGAVGADELLRWLERSATPGG